MLLMNDVNNFRRITFFYFIKLWYSFKESQRDDEDVKNQKHDLKMKSLCYSLDMRCPPKGPVLAKEYSQVMRLVYESCN